MVGRELASISPTLFPLFFFNRSFLHITSFPLVGQLRLGQAGPPYVFPCIPRDPLERKRYPASLRLGVGMPVRPRLCRQFGEREIILIRPTHLELFELTPSMTSSLSLLLGNYCVLRQIPPRRETMRGPSPQGLDLAHIPFHARPTHRFARKALLLTFLFGILITG